MRDQKVCKDLALFLHLMHSLKDLPCKFIPHDNLTGKCIFFQDFAIFLQHLRKNSFFPNLGDDSFLLMTEMNVRM